jgi:hypothetical protein
VVYWILRGSVASGRTTRTITSNLSRNCNHFCNVLCERLSVPKLTGKDHRGALHGFLLLNSRIETTCAICILALCTILEFKTHYVLKLVGILQ